MTPLVALNGCCSCSNLHTYDRPRSVPSLPPSEALDFSLRNERCWTILVRPLLEVYTKMCAEREQSLPQRYIIRVSPSQQVE